LTELNLHNTPQVNYKPSKSQTLMTGVYRSGTEFISLLVSNHPDLSSTMYHVNGIRFIKDKYQDLSQISQLKQAVTDTANRLEERYSILLNSNKILNICDNVNVVNWAQLYDIIMSYLWLEKSNNIHWMEKCQLVWRSATSFIELMPNGKVILIIRDPRAVLASFKKHTYAEPPAYLGAIFNCFDIFKLICTELSFLENEKIIFIKYEDTVINPALTAERIYSFLGLRNFPLADKDSLRDAYGKSWHANSSFHDNTPGFDINAAIERWKGNLSNEEISITEIVCGEYMEELGYKLIKPKSKFSDIKKIMLEDSKIKYYFDRWEISGKGIQEFPSDPTNKNNWSENIVK